MLVVKKKGGSPVKAASINRNLLRQAELLGLSGDAARIAAAGAQIAEISGKKLPLMPTERALPPPLDWSLNGSFNLWLDANNPLYFEKVGTPTLNRGEQTVDKSYMSHFSCRINVDANEGIRQRIANWTRDKNGYVIYDQYFRIPWTLLVHICERDDTSGTWRLRLGWFSAVKGWTAYKEIIFDALTLPQYETPIWPSALIHLPPKADADGELTFELVAHTAGALLIDSFQLLPGKYGQDTYPIWTPPALTGVEIDWSKDGSVGAGTYKMAHAISPIKLSAFKVTADTGVTAPVFTPRVDGVNMTNLAVTLPAMAGTGMAHHQGGYYCSLNSLLDVVTSAARNNVCATLFGVRLPW